LIKRLVILTVLLATASAPGEQTKLPLRHLWVYVRTNLLTDENVEATLSVADRAAAAGYTGIVLADSKFMRWDNLPAKYLRNVRNVRQGIRRRKLDCIASVCPIGHSSSLLSRDPNLAAGLPVRDAPFVVRAGRLIPADDTAKIANGSFEDFRRNRPVGWRFADRPGKISFIDTAEVNHGKASLRMQDIDVHDPKHGNGRVMQRLKVRPFRYYHVSAAVKTENFAAADRLRIVVLAKGVSLNHYYPQVEKTQDWRRVHITFNILEFDQVNLYLGVWRGKSGKIWWDDVRIEPGGLVNVVRRAGTPLRAVSGDGKTAYVEGRDFRPPRDPLLGNRPYAGAFSVWHRQPTVTVPAGSRLREGQRIALSYYHTALIGRGQVACDMTEPELYEILRWHVNKVHEALRPDGYFMQHDEIRVQGWEPAFERRKLTCGAALAENVRRCTRMIGMADPGRAVYVWSDMFDPHHNARKTGRYYLVKGDGPWHGSWKGLAKEVTVVNWHGHNPGRAESLKYFADRGHRQILAGYYDGPPERIADWLQDAGRLTGVIGVMYTTWRQNYDDLERFAAQVNKFRQ